MQTSPAASQPRIPTPAPVTAAAPAVPVHEIARARESLTPQTNALVGDTALGFRVGKASMAGILNDSVRFRVEGDGPMAERTLVPDSEAAHAVLDSRAGAKLTKQLMTATASLSGLEGVENLKTFVLPKDVDGVVVNMLLAGKEQGERQPAAVLDILDQKESHTHPIVRNFFREDRADVNERYRRGVAAWNSDGTIVFRPDVARSMLTAAGAFLPGEGANKMVSSAKLGADITNHVPTHEAQHSASPVSDKFYTSPGKWLEESIAEVLSDTPAIMRRTAASTGVNPHSYAGHMAHEPAVDLGWKDWKPQKQSVAEHKDNEQQVSRNYARSQDVLRSLLGLSGYSFRSQVQTERAKQFLQAEPVETLADRLASTLVAKWGVDPARTTELSGRISTVIDDEGGLKQLKSDFGIG